MASAYVEEDVHVHHHQHGHCAHKDVKYCSVCSLTYCVRCGKEWGGTKVVYRPTPYTVWHGDVPCWTRTVGTGTTVGTGKMPDTFTWSPGCHTHE